MSASTPVSVYALASGKGVAIPFDVARPISGAYSTGTDAIIFNLQANILTIITVWVDSLSELEVVDTVTADTVATMVLVPGVLVDLAVVTPNAGEVFVTPIESGTCVLNHVVRWTQLDNQNFGVS